MLSGIKLDYNLVQDHTFKIIIKNPQFLFVIVVAVFRKRNDFIRLNSSADMRIKLKQI